jgi:lipopolysaccharide heptosyltransferase II
MRVTPTPADWARARDILCIRLDTIGDVLMTTPAIRALKEVRSDRRITLMTSRAGAAVAALVPEIDDVIVYDAPWLKATPPRPDSRREYAMADLLRERGFDAAVIFTTFSQSPLPTALLCYLADIPLRLAHCRENAYHLLTTRVVEREPEHGIRHEVERQLDLVAAVGGHTGDRRLSLRMPPDDRARVAALLASLGVGDGEGGTWFVLHPGATAPSRRYPPELFADAVERIVERTGASVLVTGDATEVELAERVRAGAPGRSHVLAGVLTLGELSALIAHAPVLLTNNTGPAHIAAAVGTPVVDLYALTNPQHTPWMVPSRVLSHDVPCRNCFRSICPERHHRCLLGVRPDQVADAVLELLAGARAPEVPARDARPCPGPLLSLGS